MDEMESVPRRMRRFYRDDGASLVNHISRQIEKAAGIKEVEKQKIILSLKRQLEKTGESEKKDLAVHVLERASNGKDEAREVVFNEVLKYQGRGQELSGREADEIAESIYSQLKERDNTQKMLLKLGEKKRKEEEKLQREIAKKISEKEKGMPRSRQRDARGLGAFGVSAPEKIRRADSFEVEKIKRELSTGLGKSKKTEEDEEEEENFSEIKKELGMKDDDHGKDEEEDSTFDELEKMSGGADEGGSGESEGDSDEEFSMEGFETDLDSEKKKKKEQK
ncbi:MAG: hypothetical protein V1493_03610 [Candidatus Diapherotrites archaeon]